MGNCFFGKDAMTIQEERIIFSTNGSEKLNTYKQKNETGFLQHIQKLIQNGAQI